MSFDFYWRIHRALNQLALFSNPKEATPHLGPNGIYFFYQRGERFPYDGTTYDRIVRVGINENDGNFPTRLKQHYSGNSVFAGHVYDALGNTERGWPRCGTKERWRRVREYIGNNCWFRIISLTSANEAKKWEEQIIATIAPYSYQFTSKKWIGLHAKNPNVVSFGLWNSEHTKAFDKEFTIKDMRDFERLVAQEERRQQRKS